MKRGGAGKRRDSNEGAIIDALHAYGCFTRQCHGDGVPDLVVRYRGTWYVLEVKTETGSLRSGQTDYTVVRSVDDALRAIGAIT